jgi:hypothetical protein
LKAFCLAVVSLFVIAAPAAAEEATDNLVVLPPADGVASDETQPYRLEWLLQKNADDDARSVWLSGDAQADEEFARNVRALLQRANEQVRLTSASPDSGEIRMHLRCFAKRVVTSTPDRPASFVPALEWSAEDSVHAPLVSTRFVRACEVRLSRRGAAPEAGPATGLGTGPATGPVMMPYSVELPISAQSN